MNIIKKSIATLAILTATLGVAQEASKTTFSGNADFYYRFDFANAGNAANNSLTSFTKSNDSFELGMASIKATHKEGKASVVADLGFGNRASEFTYNDPANQFMVKQLNMTYEFSDKFKITAGAFATHLGFELVDAVDNKNYSMSYAFTNGPFFNTGVKAQYTSGKFSIMAGLTNPTDFKTALANNTNQKTIIGQIGYTGDSGSAFLNFNGGGTNKFFKNSITPTLIDRIDEDKKQIDFVATKKVSDKFTLGLNGTYAMVKAVNTFTNSEFKGNWFSAIVYAQYGWSKVSSLAYRLEYLGDKDAIISGVKDNNIIANTLSFNFKEGRFTFIPEVRFDMSKEEIFAKNKDLDPSKSAASILFATTYSF